MLNVLKSLVLAWVFSGCVALPTPPKTAICLYNNFTKDIDRDYTKQPGFMCRGSNATEFVINWHSKSAKNMVCTPAKDWIQMNKYYKQVFEIVEREFLKNEVSK